MRDEPKIGKVEATDDMVFFLSAVPVDAGQLEPPSVGVQDEAPFGVKRQGNVERSARERDLASEARLMSREISSIDVETNLATTRIHSPKRFPVDTGRVYSQE